MNTSFTPGPWIAIGSLVRSAEDAWTTISQPYTDGRDGPVLPYLEQKANARLIAAAPALYAALHNLVARGLISTDGDHYDEAIEALQQATGQAS